MSFSRIKAVFLRYFYLCTKLEQLSDLLYWPALDITLWGMASVWMKTQEATALNVPLAILTGVVFWHIVWRGNYEVTVNLLQEFWNRNLVNLFSTPLKFTEWTIAVILIALVKIMIGIAFGAFAVWLLYTLNVFTVGWAFLPFMVSLALSGWFIGFLTAGIIIYFGQRLQMLAWMMAYAFSPFSAVFYPVSILPPWAQKIAFCLPTTYIFEGMRQILYQGVFSPDKFYISMGLNAIYLTLSLIFYKWMFEKSRVKGLARLE